MEGKRLSRKAQKALEILTRAAPTYKEPRGIAGRTVWTCRDCDRRCNDSPAGALASPNFPLGLCRTCYWKKHRSASPPKPRVTKIVTPVKDVSGAGSGPIDWLAT